MRLPLALLLSLSPLIAACSSPPPDAQPGCNPIIGDDCLTPFPSAFFESGSAGGKVTVSIPASALPQQANNTPISAARLNARDGFSPATPFLAYFKAGVDATNLPTADQGDQSMTAASAVQILDANGKRVPVMAELDENVGQGDKQVLIIRPLIRLQANARYIVALVGLKDATGKPLATAPWKALRDKGPLSKSLQAVQQHYESDIFPVLTAAGVQRSQLTAAWDVITSSEATNHLLAMRDTAFAMTDALTTPTYAITTTTDAPDSYLAREILATVKAPSYLADDSGKSLLVFDGNGQPMVRAMVDVPIVVHIPQCAANATAPLPIIVFGHGLFGNALDTLRSSGIEQDGNNSCMVMIATDWLGVSSSDFVPLGQVVGSDLNGLMVMTDRLQQAHVNFLTMTRTFLRHMLTDPAMQLNGKPVSDGSNVYYFGVSNGGIQGGTFMALTPDVLRGALNVPGSEWSLLIFRSADFNVFKPLLNSTLPAPMDQQIFVAMMQSEFDYTDPITFAPHVTGMIAPPLAGPTGPLPAKQVLLQESEGDAQVTNLSTRTLARTLGVGGFDLTVPVAGIPVQAPPLSSAYTQWDSHPTPLPPATNVSLPKDNGAHTAVIGNAKALQQIMQFLTTGMIVSVCNGPCNI